MFGFTRKKADVVSHWYVLQDSFQLSSSDFYAEIEQELSARQVPGLTITRVDFAEGNLLSDRRTYLRMLRERLVFDVCAAPFGRAFFFSLRFAEIPAVIKWWELAAGLIGLGIILGVLFKIAGAILGLILFAVLIGAAVYVARNAVGLGLQDLDGTLIKTAVIGPIYERFLRKETYYREDTRLMYQTVIDEVVKKKVEEVTAAKGVKFIETHDCNPILGELYKKATVRFDREPRTGA